VQVIFAASSTKQILLARVRATAQGQDACGIYCTMQSTAAPDFWLAGTFWLIDNGIVTGMPCVGDNSYFPVPRNAQFFIVYSASSESDRMVLSAQTDAHDGHYSEEPVKDPEIVRRCS